MPGADELIEYNEDELEAPQWINEKYFLKVLRKYEGVANIELKELIITPGTAKGDHFASVMFRARLKYLLKSRQSEEDVEERRLSMIIKTLPEVDGLKKAFLESRQYFETEIAMYDDVLPRVQSILAAAGDQTQLCPKMLHHTLQPQKCIAFEDLSELNYAVVCNRSCTIAEVKLALWKLAKFHAVTYKMLQEGDTTLLAHKQQMFAMPNSVISQNLKKSFFETGVELFKAAVKQCPTLQQYLPHVELLDAEFIAKSMLLVSAERVREVSAILVLTHADFHMKNLMVRYKGDDLDDMLLVDFQMSCCGSIVQDLLYAYCMLFSAEMRRDMRDELFGYHFAVFQETLAQLNYEEIPTKEMFEAEFKKFRRFELFLVTNMLVLGYCFIEPNVDLTAFISGDKRREFYMKPAVLQEFCDLVPRYVEEGFFD